MNTVLSSTMNVPLVIGIAQTFEFNPTFNGVNWLLVSATIKFTDPTGANNIYNMTITAGVASYTWTPTAPSGRGWYLDMTGTDVNGVHESTRHLSFRVQ